MALQLTSCREKPSSHSITASLFIGGKNHLITMYLKSVGGNNISASHVVSQRDLTLHFLSLPMKREDVCVGKSTGNSPPGWHLGLWNTHCIKCFFSRVWVEFDFDRHCVWLLWNVVYCVVAQSQAHPQATFGILHINFCFFPTLASMTLWGPLACSSFCLDKEDGDSMAATALQCVQGLG